MCVSVCVLWIEEGGSGIYLRVFSLSPGNISPPSSLIALLLPLPLFPERLP